MKKSDRTIETVQDEVGKSTNLANLLMHKYELNNVWYVLMAILLVASWMLTSLISYAAPSTQTVAAKPTLKETASKSNNPIEQTIVTGQTKTEQTVLEGWFSIIWADAIPGSGFEAKDIYMLKQADGKAYQIILSEDLTEAFGGITGLDGKYIIFHGTLSKGPAREAGLQAMIAQAVELDPSKNASTAFAPKVVRGSKPYATILCKFADIPDEPKPISFFNDLMSNNYPGMSHYWQESSYNLVNLNGSNSFGWLTLPHPQSYYSANFSQLDIDCINTADASVYFPDYAGFNLMFNANIGCCAYGGIEHLTLDGVSRYWGTTFLPLNTWFNRASIVAHEMGHSFGLQHSADNNGVEYNNVWDVMAMDRAYCSLFIDPTYGCLGQHTVSYHKDRLGWIAPTKKYTAIEEGSQTVTLSRLAQPVGNGYLMVQIPISGSTTHFYTAEARWRVGYDIKLPGDAVIIHDVDTLRRNWARVQDGDNNGNTGDAGAMWTVGETFTDSANGISIRVDAITDDGFIITLNSSNVNSLVVTKPDDNGSGAEVGSLSWVITQANLPTQTIHTISFAPNITSVTLTGGSLAPLASGVNIIGRQSCAASITINGNGRGGGLVLNGNNRLQNLIIRGFAGSQVSFQTTNGSNTLNCVRLSQN